LSTYREEEWIIIKLPKTVNRLIGEAMGDYNMLANGDHVLVAVSGGIDSLVLAAILNSWQNKAPIDYDITAVHLDMGFNPTDRELISTQLTRLHIPFFIEKISLAPNKDNKNHCFICARKRRNRLFQLAEEKQFSKLAMGHHKDDIIETFFINMLYSGNLSTMTPSQELFKGGLTIIRPLAYLEKKQIIDLGRELHLQTSTPCPLAGSSKRQETRKLLQQLYDRDKNIKSSIFAALANVRQEYLL
jgi:tRNA 2-thiocytidine biosynthesis protein TtcA